MWRIHVRLLRAHRDLLLNQSLFQLKWTLKPARSFEWNKWTIDAIFANRLAQEILRRRPRYILEAGSGVSTVIAAYALKVLGSGKIVSLEHKPEYLTKTRQLIEDHGLKRFAEVQDAPLKEYVINGRPWLWYSMQGVGAGPIDLLLIDGPPRATQELARYPAMPLCLSRLSPSAIVLMDDLNRVDEQEILEMWLREFPQFGAELVNTKKGMLVYQRKR